MDAKQVSLAVAQVEAEAPEIDGKRVLRDALPILEILASNIPWWRKVLFTIGALVTAVRDYLGPELEQPATADLAKVPMPIWLTYQCGRCGHPLFEHGVRRGLEYSVPSLTCPEGMG